MQKKNAFTLIELLVVIAIIALLLAIITPALNKVKQAAQDVICKSNMHQYGIANELYFNESDDKIQDPWKCLYDSCQGRHAPTKCPQDEHNSYPGETHRYCRWHNKGYDLQAHPEYGGPFWEYLQTTKVSLCPLFRKLALSEGKYHTNHLGSSVQTFDAQFGYSMNARLGSGTDWPRKTSIKSPSRVFLWAEENMWTLDEFRDPPFIPKLSGQVLNDTALLVRKPNSTIGMDCFASFHKAPSGDFDRGVANVLFFDGSIAWHPPQDSVRLAYPPN